MNKGLYTGFVFVVGCIFGSIFKRITEILLEDLKALREEENHG